MEHKLRRVYKFFAISKYFDGQKDGKCQKKYK